ncbi:hypothetical protein [Roseisolibacter agri]|uniref:Bacterial Ig-like domain (Group 2) n=1 Tax=Roseisolibacter agri TaxID=2014610 RepID=A0AA37Q7W8_9BACT|nr:hypothetical protein [Roseisolibacter agri]GLC26317.1 hypothetical protein rosag_28300 [Roseisolibacter agri]
MSQLRSVSGRLLAALLLLTVAACDDAEIRPDYRLASNPASVAMSVGQQVAVGVRWEGQPLPNAVVTWRASPDSIVGVVIGAGEVATLMGRRAGATVVTATATDGRQLVSAPVSVTVAPRACQLGGIMVSPAAAAVVVGGRAHFTVPLVPPPPCGSADGRVDFRIVDTTVASVDTLGSVTGRRIGVTTLLVSPRGNPGMTAAATITVVGGGSIDPTPVVTPSMVDVVVGDTVRLRGTFPRFPNAPTGSSELHYRSADTTIVTITPDGLLRAVRVGQTHVRAIAVADSAYWTAVPVTVRAP